jgi:hypothetical protein
MRLGGLLTLLVAGSCWLGAPSLATPPEVRGAPAAGDARLARPVTLALGKVPLSTAVEELGRAAGVRLEAGRAVADEPVVLFARAQPAREVMRQLAGLFDFRWSRSGSAPTYRYQLDEDAKARQAAALRQRDRDETLAGLQEEIRKAGSRMGTRRTRS